MVAVHAVARVPTQHAFIWLVGLPFTRPTRLPSPHRIPPGRLTHARYGVSRDVYAPVYARSRVDFTRTPDTGWIHDFGYGFSCYGLHHHAERIRLRTRLPVCGLVGYAVTPTRLRTLPVG